MADLEEKVIPSNPLITKARMLAAGGIIAVAATMGTQVDMTPKPEPVPVRIEIAQARKGEEIKSMRTANKEVFKADSVWVHPKDAKGVEVKSDSFKVAAFNARVYARPKYFMDADGDTLRALDLTVREISALAKLNPLKTHDRYVDSGAYVATWMDDKPDDYMIETPDGRESVKYTFLGKAEKTEFATVPTATGMKQTIVLSDGASTLLKWKVDSTAPMIHAGGAVLVGKFIIDKPIAWDADNKVVPVAVAVHGDTLVYFMMPGQKYPVTVDPTTSIKNFIGGTVYNDTGATYLDKRNAASGSDFDGAQYFVGQRTTRVWRTFSCFPSIPSGIISVTACTLYAYGSDDLSTTNFNIYILMANSFKSSLTTADFNKFNGWKSSGTYDGTILNDTWNSSSMITSGWNNIIFNSAGLDSLKSVSGDSLWISIISEEDYNASEPTGNEAVGFYANGYGAFDAYISLTYTSSVYENTPTGYTLHTPNATGMKASWTNRHTTGIDSLTRYTGAGAYEKTLAKTDTSETLTGLTPNTQYIYKARVDSGGTFGYSNADTLYTLANAPTVWAFAEDPADSTKITIGFNVNSNPIATEFAIRDSVAQKWVDSTGVADESARVWRTKAQWNTTASLTGMLARTRYTIGVVGRNGDGVETAYLWGSFNNWFYPKAPTSLVASSLTTSGFVLSWNNNHSTSVDSLSLFTGAGAWASQLSKTATTTSISGLTPNTQKAYKVRVDSLTRFMYSNTVTLYTLANPPTTWAFTEDMTDSTKINIAFSANSNPVSVTYAIRDSVGHKWVSSAGIADSTYKVWKTKAQWESIAQITGRNCSEVQRFGVVARNSDGVETSYLWGYTTIGNMRSILGHITMTYGGYIDSGPGTPYSTFRDAITGSNAWTSDLYIGQYYVAPNYYVARSFLRIPLPYMESVSACTLYVNGKEDYSSTNFDVQLYNGSAWKSTITTADFDQFNGWLAGSTAYNGTRLNDVWNTTSYSADWNKIVFNAAGLSLVSAAQQDTLWLTAISGQDSAFNDPSGLEYVAFTGSADANPPYLSVAYKYYESNKVPVGVSVTSASSTSLTVSWVDSTSSETGFALVDSTTGLRFGGADSVSAGVTTKVLTGLLPNKYYSVKVMVLGGKLNGEVSSVSDGDVTWAAVTPAPTVSTWGTAYRIVGIDTAGTYNPANTLYAISDSGATLNFVMPTVDGYDTMRVGTTDSSWVWQTLSQWGNKTPGDTIRYPVGMTSRFRVYSKNVP